MSESANIEPIDRVQRDREMLLEAKSRGPLATLGAYIKLSGPGWLQSAITLGGGTLAGSLYLGVMLGFQSLWLQLTAIICGVIMLSAIGYVTLSTGQRPFQAINTHVNPVLGWSWALATFMANIVWALPQFALATGASMQNLIPRETLESGDPTTIKAMIAGAVLVISLSVVWLYDSGRWGIRLFETLLKTMVAIIVLSFFGVIVHLGMSPEGLDWAAVFRGFVPDFSIFTQPSAAFLGYLDQLDAASREYWVNLIVSTQRDIMMGAVATAVGINMTFLLPYSMLARGWDSTFRGMAIFDLATGMAIPFVLVASCVVIASSSRFHAQLPEDRQEWFTSAGMENRFNGRLTERLLALNPEFEELAKQVNENPNDTALAEQLAETRAALIAEMNPVEVQLAAMTAQRDAGDLAPALEPLTGKFTANLIFGVGVVGMAISTIIILMLISGFVVCEMLGAPQGGWVHRLGCTFPAIGVLGPFVWSGAAVYLAVPTSVFGLMLLPIAYVTFFSMMNSPALMGRHMPRGTKRIVWNLLMGFATACATFAAGFAVWSKTQWYGVAFVCGLIALAVIVQVMRGKPPLEGLDQES